MSGIMDFNTNIGANLVTDLLKFGGESFLNNTYVGAQIKTKLGWLDNTTHNQFRTIFLEAYQVYFIKRHPERQVQEIYSFFQTDEVVEILFLAILNPDPQQELGQLEQKLNARMANKYFTRQFLEGLGVTEGQIVQDFITCYLERERSAVGVPWVSITREIRRSDNLIIKKIDGAVQHIEALFASLGNNEGLRAVQELRGAIAQFTELHQKLREWKELHYRLQALAFNFSYINDEIRRIKRRGGRKAKMEVELIQPFWEVCRTRFLAEVSAFAEKIEYIGVPLGINNGELYGEAWAVELVQLRQEIDYNLERERLGDLFDALDKFDSSLSKHLANADQEMKMTADKLCDLSNRLSGMVGSL